VVVMLQPLVALPAAASPALAAKGKEPMTPVGVPVTTPVEVVRLKPGGNDPVMENV
jgi:hypothetical protein